MSKPVFDSLFNKELFSARRNRKSYLQYIAAQFAINILAIIAIISLNGVSESAMGPLALLVMALIGVVQFITFCVIGQRIRDIGYSGAWVIALIVIMAIPLLNIVGAGLLIATAIVPGDTAVANKFGASCIEPTLST